MKKQYEYIKYPQIYKAYRLLFNRSSNDWNDEPEYKMQKVRVYGETKDLKKFVVDSYGNFTFLCDKNDIFLDFNDFKIKIQKHNEVSEYDKKHLIKVYRRK